MRPSEQSMRITSDSFDISSENSATGTWALGSAMGVILFLTSLIVIGLVWRTVNLRRAGFTGAGG